MFSNFQWPQPPYFELPPGAEFTGHEPALLMLVRGPKLPGSLTRFLPSHGTVEFLLERGRVNIDVPLADILQLRLTRPIIFKPRKTEIEQRAAGLAKPSLKQPFLDEFLNGEVHEGETMGFEQQSVGLFLYIWHYAESVIRVFVPATSIKSQRIGPTDLVQRAGKQGVARRAEVRGAHIIGQAQLHWALLFSTGMP